MAEESKEQKKQRKLEKKQQKEEQKRKDLEEIEINLAGDVPLNKRQQRLLKKGKLNLDKIKSKNPTPKTVEEEAEEAKKIAEKAERSKFGVWIGNLSFDTTREDLIRFIKSKTDVTEDDIIRFNLPKKQDKIKGFCYIDFKTEDQMVQVIGLSESILNGRKLLIKNANSFEGRPEVQNTNGDNKLINLSKNPPSRILFVGNLSFDITEDILEEHFRHCGEIVRIRMATFEDTGKCKGFAFIDFKDESGPTTALTSKLTKKLINRPVRMEYGEDRSKRTPKRILEQQLIARERHTELSSEPQQEERPQFQEREFRPKRPRTDDKPRPEKRQKSSVALASAQRASAAIVPSAGKKITFD